MKLKFVPQGVIGTRVQTSRHSVETNGSGYVKLFSGQLPITETKERLKHSL